MHKVCEAPVAGVHLLADDSGLGVRLQGAFQRDVAGSASHEPHEVIVLFGAQRVHHQVAYLLRVHLRAAQALAAAPDTAACQRWGLKGRLAELRCSRVT